MSVERPLYWHYPHYGNQGGNPSSIIRLGNWKLIHYWEDGSDELYNLTKDPGESSNVANQNPVVAKELRGKLLAWLEEVGARYPEPDENYNKDLDERRQKYIVEEKWPELEKQRMLFLSEDFKPNKDWWGSMSTND